MHVAWRVHIEQAQYAVRLGSGQVASQLVHCTTAVHSLCNRERGPLVALFVCTAVVINPFNEADAVVEVAEGAAKFRPRYTQFWRACNEVLAWDTLSIDRGFRTVWRGCWALVYGPGF